MMVSFDTNILIYATLSIPLAKTHRTRDLEYAARCRNALASALRCYLQMACVGRLQPASKGQDILLEALAQPIWLERDWQLNLFGEGPQKGVLVRLVKSLNLGHRVHFAGHRAPFDIWCGHHVLVMPVARRGASPKMVEAMLWPPRSGA
jgi:glycosyltransferase involved in cell wall biosynthesis